MIIGKFSETARMRCSEFRTLNKRWAPGVTYLYNLWDGMCSNWFSGVMGYEWNFRRFVPELWEIWRASRDNTVAYDDEYCKEGMIYLILELIYGYNFICLFP